jgi:putative lipase involved disintegration of autophagic bodies
MFMSFELNGVTFASDGTINAGTQVEVGIIDSLTTSITGITKIGSTEDTSYHSESTLGMASALHLGLGFLAGDWFGNGRGRDGKGALIKFGKA